MTKLLRKCDNCKAYTLSKICKKCNVDTVYPHPPKFSLEDKYTIYRVANRHKKKLNNIST